MDFGVFDGVRRKASPLQVDLVESYARGGISRRGFLKRGGLLGLSIPFMGAIIAACGDDSEGGGSASSGGYDDRAVKAGGVLKIASQTPAGPLDPVAMADLGSYCMIVQSFEFLCGLGDGGDIAPSLAESWTPNADGSEWTFKLRKGVKWQDGGDFTADDVVATMERLIEGGNAALAGVLEAGGTAAADPTTVVFTLPAPNGNFPYLVSLYNAQAVITPKAFALGSTLDPAAANGTGPWKITKYDAATGATFVRNDTWWGGKANADSVEWIFSDDLATQVSGVQGGAVDAILQFSVVGGDALLADPNFNTIAARTSTHREVWMRCDEGQFTDKRVRQAIALCMDREKYVTQLFQGRADIGNDHPIAPVYPFFDDSVPQRKKDVEKAKKLLADAGATGLKATMNAPKLQEIPELAALIQTDAKEIGVEITLNIESTDTFYNQWCLTYDPICDGGQEFGIVDYGHRAVPDVYLNAAYATGVWNSAHYQSDEFNAAFKEYQAALDVEGHKKACKKLQTIANEDVPNAIPYFYNSLSGHSKKIARVNVSALGQMFVDKAGLVG